MTANLKIARELLKMARSLVADESWYGPKTKAFLIGLKNSMSGLPGGGQSVLKINGTGRFYVEKSSVRKYIGIPVATASCNMSVSLDGGDIVLNAGNFYVSRYDDLQYGDWIESPVSLESMQITPPGELRFAPANDDDACERISQYHANLLSILQSVVDKTTDEYGI